LLCLNQSTLTQVSIQTQYVHGLLEIKPSCENFALSLQNSNSGIRGIIDLFEDLSYFVEKGHVHGVECLGAGDGDPDDAAFF
jgi:hypothetical protein